MISPLLFLSLGSTALGYPTGSWPSTELEYNVKSCAVEMLNAFYPYSCENSTTIYDSCCFEKGGVLLQAQFWDFSTDKLAVALNGTSAQKESLDAKGDQTKGWFQFGFHKSSDMPIEKSFTIHGLWSDNCDGTWSQFCQPDIEVSNDKDNLTDLIVNKFHKNKLYSIMSKYWVNTATSNVAGSSNAELWEHEYNKHGTCMNTVDPLCFKGPYQEFEAAVEFYQRVVEIWEALNTYEFLSKEGILPTVQQQYSKTDILSALSDSHAGKDVHIGCTSEGALDEVWYYYHVKGSVLTGDYKAVDAVGSNTCPDQIWYIPK